jgi:hypothetical protein
VVDEITGRKVQDESCGRYGKPYAAKLLWSKRSQNSITAWT